jgi:hypothetical protein
MFTKSSSKSQLPIPYSQLPIPNNVNVQMKTFLCTVFALLAFAGNPVLCRLALVEERKVSFLRMSC